MPILCWFQQTSTFNHKFFVYSFFIASNFDTCSLLWKWKYFFFSFFACFRQFLSVDLYSEIMGLREAFILFYERNTHTLFFLFQARTYTHTHTSHHITRMKECVFPHPLLFFLFASSLVSEWWIIECWNICICCFCTGLCLFKSKRNFGHWIYIGICGLFFFVWYF